MAIARKPGGSPASEQQIEALIRKGGTEPGLSGSAAVVRGSGRPARPGTAKVLLRIPEDLLERVQDAVAAKPLPTTRQAWILEALFEKLQRESRI